MKTKESLITASDMAGPELTLKASHRFLELNGVDWSFGWFKTQVALGKIPSLKKFNSRIVKKIDLEKIVKDYKTK